MILQILCYRYNEGVEEEMKAAEKWKHFTQHSVLGFKTLSFINNPLLEQHSTVNISLRCVSASLRSTALNGLAPRIRVYHVFWYFFLRCLDSGTRSLKFDLKTFESKREDVSLSFFEMMLSGIDSEKFRF